MANFWPDFWANFLSDVIAGVILASSIAMWINKRERSEQSRAAKRAEIEKAIRYLQIIKSEIETLLSSLPVSREQFAETGWGRAIRIDIPFWAVAERSGELPGLIQPDLLLTLATFYDHLAYSKRTIDLVFEGWLIPNPQTVPGMNLKLEAFVNMTLSGIDQALSVGHELPEQINTELTALEEQLANIMQ